MLLSFLLGNNAGLITFIFQRLTRDIIFQDQVLEKSFRKDSDFFLNLYLCFVRISPQQH